MDWEYWKEVAFGPLNLKPFEFWSYAPSEVRDLMNGYQWRAKRREEERADMALKQRIATNKKRVRVTDLMHKKSDKKTTPEESQQVVNDLIEEMM